MSNFEYVLTVILILFGLMMLFKGFAFFRSEEYLIGEKIVSICEDLDKEAKIEGVVLQNGNIGYKINCE